MPGTHPLPPRGTDPEPCVAASTVAFGARHCLAGYGHVGLREQNLNKGRGRMARRYPDVKGREMKSAFWSFA